MLVTVIKNKGCHMTTFVLYYRLPTYNVAFLKCVSIYFMFVVKNNSMFKTWNHFQGIINFTLTIFKDYYSEVL